jgi:ketosteroid isomerase-like protein
MSTNQETIKTFYEAFARKDSATMAQCYHEEAVFNDAAFVNLNASQVRAMWKMLCERGADLKLEYSEVSVEGDKGKCRWDAHYTFSQTRRKVHNIIHAEFEFKDGKIIKHTDNFDFYRWSRQALGMTGLLLGWTGFLKNKVQQTAKASLDKYMKQS